MGKSWPRNMIGDETTIGFGVFRFGFAFLFTVVSSKILVVFPRVINCRLLSLTSVQTMDLQSKKSADGGYSSMTVAVYLTCRCSRVGPPGTGERQE